MKYREVLIIAFIILFVRTVKASEKLFIPSYDDWYEGDIKQANALKNYFKEPDDAINYAQYRYIGAHAAEKYPRFFPQYALQEQPITSLLAVGVRGLMITVFNWSKNWSSLVREGRSTVCSHPSLETIVFTKNGKKLYQTLHYEMNRIFNFLKINPQAVITIVLDDQSDIAHLLGDMKEIIAKNNYNPLFTPSDWNRAKEKMAWPTLGWMRKNNKRLILFTQVNRNHTEFTWPVESYFWENNYGNTDPSILCTEEKESLLAPHKRNRTLISFGCFGSIGAITQARNYRKCFDYDFIKRTTIDCRQRRFAQGRIFNGYWADHIIQAVNDADKAKRKTAFDYVNELNAMVKKK